MSQAAVPKVHLHATHESATQDTGIEYGDLKKYAQNGDAAKEGRNSRQGTHVNPEQPSDSTAKESSELKGQAQPERIGG